MFDFYRTISSGGGGFSESALELWIGTLHVIKAKSQERAQRRLAMQFAPYKIFKVPKKQMRKWMSRKDGGESVEEAEKGVVITGGGNDLKGTQRASGTASVHEFCNLRNCLGCVYISQGILELPGPNSVARIFGSEAKTGFMCCALLIGSLAR